MLEENSLHSTDTLLALADALRTPLMRLSLNSHYSHDVEQIQIITSHALRDIDAFMTAVESSKTQLTLETMSLGALMGDAVERVRPYARMSGVTLCIDDHSQHQPVLGNATTLGMGLELVMKTMCDFPVDAEESSVIVRADTRHGYPRLGVYRSDIDLSASDLALARKLIGGVKVNVGLFQQLGALRVVVASKLLEPFSLTLRAAKSDGKHGLALQLAPSSQVGLF